MAVPFASIHSHSLLFLSFKSKDPPNPKATKCCFYFLLTFDWTGLKSSLNSIEQWGRYDVDMPFFKTEWHWHHWNGAHWNRNQTWKTHIKLKLNECTTKQCGNKYGRRHKGNEKKWREQSKQNQPAPFLDMGRLITCAKIQILHAYKYPKHLCYLR